MTKIFTVLFAVMLFSVSDSIGQPRSSKDLLGIWSGSQLRVEFIDNSKVSVILPGGKQQIGNYRGDFFHTPVLLEMSFNDGGGKVEFKCLVEQVQYNQLRWQVFDKTDTPKKFTGSAYLLTRVKN